MASIVVVSGPNKGDFYPLDKARSTVVGRGEDCLIQIVDQQVSRWHLKISFDGTQKRYQASDVGSANGTFINDKQITGAVSLSADTMIRIGDSELMFTAMDFPTRASAFQYYERERQRGELDKDTIVD